MNILRSVTRRGFSVGTAGWFTVLRPNTWFPASRLARALPGLDKRVVGAPERVAGPGAPESAGGQVKAVRWLAMERAVEPRNKMRAGTAIVGALAITSAMLWWIMHP